MGSYFMCYKGRSTTYSGPLIPGYCDWFKDGDFTLCSYPLTPQHAEQGTEVLILFSESWAVQMMQVRSFQLVHFSTVKRKFAQQQCQREEGTNFESLQPDIPAYGPTTGLQRGHQAALEAEKKARVLRRVATNWLSHLVIWLFGPMW